MQACPEIPLSDLAGGCADLAYWIDDRVDKIGAGEDHEKQDRHTHKGDNEDKQDDLLVNPVE